MAHHTFSYEGLGTHWKIIIWDTARNTSIQEIEREVRKISGDFDAAYSRFRKDSLVTRISQQTGILSVPQDLTAMLSLYMNLYIVSEKKLTPLIGNTISDLGYDAVYSLTPKKIIRPVPDLLETIKVIDATHIELSKHVLFDFGALGKGYLVDKISAYLKTQGIKRFLVNGSGDILYFGDEPITVGLEHPSDTTKAIGTVEMTTGAMCSSAINRRAWRNRHHVIDPSDLSSPTDILATWVMTKTTVLADALATCLFFVPPENFIPQYEFAYCMVNKEYKVKRSKNFLAELF